jgi:hypothetical protein
MSTILQVQQSLQKCSENAFHSLAQSQVHHTKNKHGDDFVERVFVMPFIVELHTTKNSHTGSTLPHMGVFLGTQEQSFFTGENFVKK